jgi:membrane protein YdbS with pleckstrin-like domain
LNRYRTNNRDDEVTAVAFLLALLVTVILSITAMHYWWNANENENWLVATRLTIVNVVWSAVVLNAIVYHWAFGLICALVVGGFFLAVT